MDLTELDAQIGTIGGLIKDARLYSPLALAFVGDGVFDLVIRTLVAADGNRPVKKMHREKAGIVNAHAQAQMVKRLTPFLSVEEEDVLRRGRNAHSATTAKNQSIADYRLATGLEALCGYLYLTGRTERLLELIRLAWDGSVREETEEHGKTDDLPAGEERDEG
ncbi:MAG: ribonuclease III [Lachnospiraceae bacterium]|nr:ribonuclease III [Lachnospiraceae bacterium]